MQNCRLGQGWNENTGYYMIAVSIVVILKLLDAKIAIISELDHVWKAPGRNKLESIRYGIFDCKCNRKSCLVKEGRLE